MTTEDNTTLAGLRARYDELHAELAATHDAKPIDWDTVARIEVDLGALMDELSKAVWSRDAFFGGVAMDAARGWRLSAADTRNLTRQINRGAQ